MNLIGLKQAERINHASYKSNAYQEWNGAMRQKERSMLSNNKGKARRR